MKKIYRILRYEWPLHLILFFTSIFPDNVIFVRLRGFLARPFFNKCGKKFGLARNVYFYNPSKITIGENVYIAYGCWIKGETIIQDEVMLGPNCIIAPGDHLWEKGSFRNSQIEKSTAYLGKGSWMGGGSMIVGKNPKLGSGSVLAANSVLNKESDSNSVYSGTPAKKIKTLK